MDWHSIRRVRDVELSEALLQKIGGWQAVKEARAILAAGKVLSAKWEPPHLTGEVQGGAGVISSGLVIKDAINVDNLCKCKESRQWGKMCSHSLAVGLEVLNPKPKELPVAPIVPVEKLIAEPAKPSLPIEIAEDGAELELAVILPPNISGALGSGRVSVFFEVLVDGKRMPMAMLSKDQDYQLETEHLKLLEQIVDWADGELPATLQLGFDQFSALLELLPDDAATFGRKEKVVISNEPLPIGIKARLLESGEIRLEAEIPKPAPAILPGKTCWALVGTTFSRVELPTGGLALLQAPQTLSRNEVPNFLQNDFPVLSATGAMDPDFALDDFEIVIEPPIVRCHFEGGLARLRAKLQIEYFENQSSTTSGASIWLPDPQKSNRYRLRDFSAEQEAIARLARRGFEGPDKEGRWQLSGQDAVLTFFAREYPRLEREWNVTLEDRLDWSLDKNVERIEPRCEVRSSGEQWFDFGVQFETGSGEKFSTADIQSLVLGGRSHKKLSNGKYALIDTGAVEELQELLIDAAPRQEQGGYRFRNEQAAFLNETVGKKLGWEVTAPTGWQETAGRGKAVEKVEFGRFAEVLRPYQTDGVQWLHKLRTNGFGGILADEMGLGKTLQALAHLSIMRKRRGSDGAKKLTPTLVICPTSLVFNWEAEAAKFAPDLRVLALQGANRKKDFDRIPEHDLVITSYALARRDVEAYGPVEFDTVILDEAQHIKNRASQNAQAVKSIRCRHRLVLTGTPMENSVLDLWSIFDFLMPGYLGSVNDFRERYELPLSKGKDPVLQDRLSRRVRPFILRRLKKDVAKDLPDKLEQINFCELTTNQRAVYQQVLSAGRQEILDSVGKQGFGGSRMVILNALLRLRQICCDLRLLKLDEKKIEAPSGKLDMFGELLEEIIDGGHRALVFSQFTSMLALLRERLDAEGIEYCQLDGSTKNRGEVVGKFQRSSIPVFLISLKAGGVGLNLTAADTVVHFDPWWNPAVEDQATDRAHRIGQKRVVTSYKLITRDTIEEKILKLQQKKREAIKAVFGDEGALTDSLSWEEVQDLFA